MIAITSSTFEVFSDRFGFWWVFLVLVCLLVCFGFLWFLFFLTHIEIMELSERFK